jgi:hypothetical protein
MLPALITFGYKYNLNENLIEPILLKLYHDCLDEFKREVSFYKSNGFPSIDDFIKIRPDIQERIDKSIGEILQYRALRSGREIPSLSDQSENLKFITAGGTHKIIEGSLSGNKLSIDLTFYTEIFSLIMVIGDKLLLAAGDKTESLVGKSDMPTFTLKLTGNLWINSFKEI